MTGHRPLPASIFTPGFTERFWARVDVKGPDECWPWRLKLQTNGYGVITTGGRRYQAHRVALSLSRGHDIGDRLAMHSCDSPPCCNPAHLRGGTAAENTADMVSRGRNHVNPKGRNSESGSRVVPFRLPPATADLLADAARSRGVSVSALLRSLVHDLLR